MSCACSRTVSDMQRSVSPLMTELIVTLTTVSARIIRLKSRNLQPVTALGY